MKSELILKNAQLILPDEVIHGTIHLKNDKIVDISSGSSMITDAIDCHNDYIIPGLVEMHTDNVEKHVVPRPGIFWPSPYHALIAHDNQIICSGITTVFNAISLGLSEHNEVRSNIVNTAIKSVQEAMDNALLQSDHYIHLRCELPSSTVMNEFNTHIDNPYVKMVSIMDHTVGQRQWRNLDKWRTYHKNKKWTEEEFEQEVMRRKVLQEKYGVTNRLAIVPTCKDLGLPLASHDDTTEEHSIESAQEGITISEFPTTMEAAQVAHNLSLKIIMGSPNIVRGESHSGNISAGEIAEAGMLDGLSSDYMPISLLHGAFKLHQVHHLPLPQAISTVTYGISDMVNMFDRGRLAVNQKADILRVTMHEDLPIVNTVIKDGKTIYSLRGE